MKNLFKKSSGKSDEQKRGEVDLAILNIVNGEYSQARGSSRLLFGKFFAIVVDQISGNVDLGLSEVDENTKNLLKNLKNDLPKTNDGSLHFLEGERANEYGPIEMKKFIGKHRDIICAGSEKFKSNYLDSFLSELNSKIKDDPRRDVEYQNKINAKMVHDSSERTRKSELTDALLESAQNVMKLADLNNYEVKQRVDKQIKELEERYEKLTGKKAFNLEGEIGLVMSNNKLSDNEKGEKIAALFQYNEALKIYNQLPQAPTNPHVHKVTGRNNGNNQGKGGH